MTDLYTVTLPTRCGPNMTVDYDPTTTPSGRVIARKYWDHATASDRRADVQARTGYPSALVPLGRYA